MHVRSINIIISRSACVCVFAVSGSKCFTPSYCLFLTVEIVEVAVVVSVICAGEVSNSSLSAEYGSIVVSACG